MGHRKHSPRTTRAGGRVMSGCAAFVSGWIHCGFRGATRTSGRQWPGVHGRFTNDAADFVLLDRVSNPSDSPSQYKQRVFGIHAEASCEVDVRQGKVGFQSSGIAHDGYGPLEFSEVGVVGENFVQALKHCPRAMIAIL